jgi:hypothetical protein
LAKLHVVDANSQSSQIFASFGSSTGSLLDDGQRCVFVVTMMLIALMMNQSAVAKINHYFTNWKNDWAEETTILDNLLNRGQNRGVNQTTETFCGARRLHHTVH